MLSIWQQQSFTDKTDVCIVGAGLTGLLTAIFIRRKYPRTRVRILERGSFPEGASAKNAGFACFGSLSEILDDIKAEGSEFALNRVVRRSQGLRVLRELTRDLDIGYVSNHGYEIFTEAERDIYQDCLDALKDINHQLSQEIGYMPFSLEDSKFGFNCLESMIFIQGEAALDSGKLLQSLISLATNEGVEISFGSEVVSMDKSSGSWCLSTKSAEFKAEVAVLCTNAFTYRFLDNIPILPYRGQILLTEPIPDLGFKANFHLNQGYYYFRPYASGIMLGGGRHLDRENEQTDQQQITEKIQNALEEVLYQIILPGKKPKIRHRWAGTLAYGPSNEKEPILQEVEPGLHVAARLGGMGVAMAPHLAEKLVARLFN